tara:strand:+ start:358 stop:903 length:546 start_codon:yes stop_codon:yes gene_type:complete
MLASFIYVGRESLEMMFLTLMVSTAIGLNWRIYSSALTGLLAGLGTGWFLGGILEPYEVGMYAVLSLLMLYLFFTSRNMAKHIKQHVDTIKSGQAGMLVGMFTIFFIFAREFMEVFIFMFQAVNNTKEGWIGATLAISLVFGCFPLIRKHLNTQTMFSVTRYAFLVFAFWFGYEALEHLIG